jgi:SAM-dependent methyltransferase
VTGEQDVTGERLIPATQHGELVHAEHLARYRLAAQLARGRRVLDVACGEGYGTAMLNDAGATESVGVDIDATTIADAERRYAGSSFSVGDVTELRFEDGRFDLVVSFETIEHVKEPERALDELSRVLADDGLLLVSTPNKHQYLVENEFHEREFTHEEFVELLAARFPVVEVLLQHNWNASLILSPERAADADAEHAHRLELLKTVGIAPGEELYTVAICTVSGEVPALGPLGVAASTDEAHELARRLLDAESTARHWHDEYQAASRTIVDMRSRLSWRLTKPFRVVRWLKRRRSG